jgi:RND family efflux transporter MFP subunit
MKKFWRWTIPILILAAALSAALYFWRTHRAGNDAPTANTPAEQKPEPGHLKLTAEQIQHAGIKLQQVAAATFQPSVDLFGTIQEDPAASFTLRSESAGAIENAPGKNWPNLGENLPDNTTVGLLNVRPVPADQIALATQRTTLETQLATAQAEANTAKAALAAAQAAHERLAKLNAQDKNVSDRVVEEALARVQAEQARLAAAAQTLTLAQSSLKALKTDAGPQKLPLVLQRGGEVVEVNAHPGEAIEAGQPILRVANFDHVLAAVTLPPGMQLSAPEATLTTFGQPDRSYKAVRAGVAPLADPKTRGQVLMFRVNRAPADPPMRPGTPVTAHLPAPGDALHGVIIPDAAVVHYLGKTWVYVAGEDNTFERREVTLNHRTADAHDWFVLDGVKPGEQVVTTGAAMLLSMEVNAAFSGGGD